MALSISAKNNALNSIRNDIHSGTIVATPYIQIRTGTEPASANLTATGTLLAVLQMSATAFKVAAQGRIESNTIARGTVVTTGVPGYCRIFNRDNVAVYDGPISENSSLGIKFNTTTFAVGGIVEIKSLYITI